MVYDKQLLVIGKVWPEPESSAAGSRMIQLLKLFIDEGFTITFCSAAQKSAFSFNLETLGIRCEFILLNDSSFDEFVSNIKPHVVLFDRFMTEEQFGWRVREQCPDALTMLDTEDLHFLRIARQKSLCNEISFEDHLYSEATIREIASILRTDLSLIISKVEMELLRSTFGVSAEQLFYLPLLIERNQYKSLNEFPDFKQRRHFISIGNFLHAPNWDSVQFLNKEIWPEIRKQLPQAELHIYGAYPSEKVWALNNKSTGFIIKGRANIAKAVIAQSRVLLAPIRFGAGLKGKLLDAMLTGTPSVTTKLGAEAMTTGEWPGSITDDIPEFVRAAVSLYTRQNKWERARRAIRPVLEQMFNAELFTKSFRTTLHKISNDVKSHRRQHFIGQVLQHQTVNALKYMGKWIEAKNRD